MAAAASAPLPRVCHKPRDKHAATHLVVDDLPKLRHSVEGLLSRDVGNDERSVQPSERVRRQAALLFLRYLHQNQQKNVIRIILI